MCSLLLSVYICFAVVIKCGTAQTVSTPAKEAANAEGFLFGPFKSSFRCPEKYGYYADVENNCRVFHLCNPRQSFQTGKTDVELFSFLCPPNTIFNQQTMNCARREESIPCSEAVDFYFVNDFVGLDKAATLRIRNIRDDFDHNALEEDLLRSRMAIPQIFTSLPIEISGPRYLPDNFRTTYLKSGNILPDPDTRLERSRLDQESGLPPTAVPTLLQGPFTPSPIFFEPTHNPQAPTESPNPETTTSGEPLYVLENLQLRQLLRNLFEVTAKTNETFEKGLKDSSRRQTVDGKLAEIVDRAKFDIIDFRNPEPTVEPAVEFPVYIPSASNLNEFREILRKSSSKFTDISASKGSKNRVTTESPRTPKRIVVAPTLPIIVPTKIDSSSPGVVLHHYLVKSQAIVPKTNPESGASQVRNLSAAVNKKNNRQVPDTLPVSSGNSVKLPEEKEERLPVKVSAQNQKPSTPKPTLVTRPIVQAATNRDEVPDHLLKPADVEQAFGKRMKPSNNTSIAISKTKTENVKPAQNETAAVKDSNVAKSGFIKVGAANTTQPEVLKILERSFREFQELILKRPFKQEVFLRALDLPLQSTGSSLRQLIEAQEKLSANRNRTKTSVLPAPPKKSSSVELPQIKEPFNGGLDSLASGRSETVLTTPTPMGTHGQPSQPESPLDSPTVPPPKRRRKTRANSRKPRSKPRRETSTADSADKDSSQRSRTRRVKRIADPPSTIGGTFAGVVSFVAESVPSKPIFVWNPETKDPVFFKVPVLK